jgi:tRNA (cytidine/uridine-2'-O-)-methyltransferase
MNIVLYQPEIPQNTGNISRTCAATGTSLHLIEPLGFELSDKYLKRAGLDYWQYLDLHVHHDFRSFLGTCLPRKIWAISTRGTQTYSDVTYGADDYLLFGRETAGLPPEILSAHASLRVPMLPDLRSLNLSNTVALTLYEALRQQKFPSLQ